MRFRVPVHGLVLLVGVVLASCGPRKDKKSTDDGGLPIDDSGYEAPPPSPGVCHALCCSDSDCITGETCTPFLPADGTLGVCTGGAASDAGTGFDGGTMMDAGGTPSGDAGLDPACWSQSPGCNPLTNASCAAGAACDVTGLVDGGQPQPQVECLYGDNTQSAGQDCDSVDGPFCIPGYHCVSNN